MAIEINTLLTNDELKIYRGADFVISKHISIHQPTLSEICDFGEAKYYSMIYNLTATPQSIKGQLWQLGLDYTLLTEYELFYSLLYKMYTPEYTSILFGDLDFTKFELRKLKSDKEERFILYQVINEDEVYVDELTYMIISDYLRKVHFIEKDERKPANNTTKMILIEDALEELKKSQNNENHSQLKNLISTMINSEGFKYSHTDVWNMKINAFMDSVKRISKIKNATLLMQSGYSGFGINLKDINKSQLDWLGGLD